MNIKQIAGLISSFVGAVLITIALYSMSLISTAKGQIHSASSNISHSPVGKMLSGEMQQLASRYDTKVMVCLIGGIVLVIAGLAIAYFYRRKH